MSAKATGIKDMKKEWTIARNGELRLEVDFGETVAFKLLSGTAEVYGMELSPNREYEVRGTKLAIFTYEGARVSVRGKCDVEYLSEETVMHAYLNTHLAIEGMRREAAERGTEGPRVVVMGVSRTTLTRILVNYAVRSGRTPMYVDLDVANGNLLMPGVVAAQVMGRLIDVEEGVGGDGGGGGQPIAYFYGSLMPADNARLYRRMLGRLAFAANGRLAAMDDPQKSGAIICCPAEMNEDLMREVQELFKASLILVVGNERLHSTLGKTMQQHQPSCTVLKLPKSGGVVSKDAAWRRAQLQSHFHRYFYGAKGEYSPFSTTLGFDEVQIRRLGEESLAPKSALPLGATRRVDESKAAKVEPSTAALLYSILAVSQAAAEDQLSDSNIAGFIYVTGVDETKKQITALSICPGKLPSPYLLQGSLKWIEK